MRNFILAGALIASAPIMAQNFCATTENQNAWFEKHPEMRAAFEQQQAKAAELDQEMFKYNYQNPLGKSASANTYTIPIVFHILHKGGSENISDAQVKDAVSILTRDFNKKNGDTTAVVAAFKNIIGNPQFSFVLATKDPNGNCTNGIVRHFDPNTDWDNDFSNFKYTWPSSKYLNVYVVNTMGSGAAGYTYPPGSGVPASADAIVILSNYVGSIGTGQPALSRALTHEVGHWFNLQHTWGNTNNPGVACGNDGVSDTPITKGYTSCNLGNTKICTSGVEENIQNYMDYAYCQRMFTAGQAARMVTSINNTTNQRNNLSSNSNLIATGVLSPASGCVPVVDLPAAISYTVCVGKKVTIKTFTSNAYPDTYQWSTNASATILTPSAPNADMIFNQSGTATVTCVASNSFGSSSASAIVYVRDPWADYSGNYSESFENNGPNLPLSWNIYNENNTTQTWKQTGDASDGNVSMAVFGDLNPGGAVHILESPSFDFVDNPGAMFSFKYAYRQKTSSTKDVFKVQASDDCGATWVDTYAPASYVMASGSGGVDPNPFIPSVQDFKLYDQLTNHPFFIPFLDKDNVRLRFYFQIDPDATGGTNRLYLDEINIRVPVGINELTRELGFNVFPNPAKDNVQISLNISQPSSMSYELLSVAGQVMMSSQPQTLPPGKNKVDVPFGSLLPKGIYFLNVNVNGTVMSKKLVVE